MPIAIVLGAVGHGRGRLRCNPALRSLKQPTPNAMTAIKTAFLNWNTYFSHPHRRSRGIFSTTSAPFIIETFEHRIAAPMSEKKGAAQQLSPPRRLSWASRSAQSRCHAGIDSSESKIPNKKVAGAKNIKRDGFARDDRTSLAPIAARPAGGRHPAAIPPDPDLDPVADRSSARDKAG